MRGKRDDVGEIGGSELGRVRGGGDRTRLMGW